LRPDPGADRFLVIINLLIQYQLVDNCAMTQIRIARTLIAAGLLLAAAFTPAARAATSAAPTAALQAVTAAAPAKTALTRQLTATGAIFAWQEVIIAPEVGGYQVASVSVEIGDHVKRGQELARLSSRLLASQVSMASAGVMQSNAMLTNATAALTRGESVFEKGALSRADLDTLRANAISAEANLATAQANLDSAQLRLNLTRVRAPDDGVISARSANIGQVVQVGTEMLRLLRRGRIEWRAEVPEADLHSIRAGMKVNVQTVEGSQLTGTVRSVAPTVQSNNRTGLIYVDIPATGGAKPGMFARGEIEVSSAAALMIPISSVVVQDGYSYIFVVKDDQVVRRRRIKTGTTQARAIEVTEGLSEGEPVVNSGVAFLNDGQRVNLRPMP
jgi:RND family efflux transporter MFP subunit